MAEQRLEIIRASVGHKRFWPKENSFLYRVFYIKIPIGKSYPKTQLFSVGYKNVFSVYEQDHGYMVKGRSWQSFIHDELAQASVPFPSSYSAYLITHPRLFGFAFNPISYWVVLDANDGIRAVLCEVRNTFKQTHNYLIFHKDHSVIAPNDVLVAKKQLYVSPFNPNEGYYEFSFTYSAHKFTSTINYFDASSKQILNTYMGGSSAELSSKAILVAILSYPFMTLLVVARIHWQAMRLYFKRVQHTVKQLPKLYTNNSTTKVTTKKKLSQR